MFSALLTGAFLSCSSQIAGTIKSGGTAEFNVNTSLEPRMAALIRSFKSMAGSSGGNQDLILDGAAISLSMAASPGMGRVNFENSGPAAIKGKAELIKVEDFLAVAGKGKRFVTFTENAENRPGQGRIVISLDRENAPEVIALLSAEASAYLSALMAPAVTGEALSRSEYLFLVSSFYGQPIADEINTAKITASIEFPGRITAIQGGTASGSRTEFQFPLIELLLLEKPLSWEVYWQK